MGCRSVGDRNRHLHRRLATGLIAVAAAVLPSLAGAPAGAAAAPLSISIQGNHFVNGSGQTIRLLGVNHPSSEYACVDGYGYNDGHQDDADAAAIASWNANAVRVPLNEDCWMGINGQPNSKTLTASGYRQAVKEYVSFLNAHGLYAILDLHWTAPGTQVAAEQQPMPDSDHSPAFWESVASTFKGNPAVVFDVFNEPYDPTDPRSGTDQVPQDKVTWNCWDTGTENGPAGGAPCGTPAYTPEGGKLLSYTVAGLQTLVNKIRGAGATQPVLVGGLDYANDLTGWLENAPNDPLNQEAASFHNYMGKECDHESCWNSEIASVAANVPVVTGEFDEDNFDEAKCENKTPSTFDQEYMNWADAHGVSYLAWGWLVLTQQEKDEEGCSAFYLLEDYGGTPAPPNGTALHEHLLSLPPGGTATTSTTTTTPGGTTTNVPPGGGSVAKPSVTLKSFGGTVQRGASRIAFTLRSAQSCSGTLSALTASKYAGVAAKRGRHRISLGTVRFTLRAGETKKVVLTLSKASRKLLATKRTLKVQITVDLASSGYRTTVFTRSLVLKVPAAHGHSGH